MATCNICGGIEFVDMPKRPQVRCAACGSLERARVAALHIRKRLKPGPGAAILHFAPERGLSALLRDIGGANYRAVDVDPSLYRGSLVEPFDLCRDIFSLAEDRYDLIVHNHVLEHLECNYSVVLIKLARALTEHGVMLFSVPIVGGDFADAIVNGTPEEKAARFGAFRHYRHFGRDFIQETLGMIFWLPATYDLLRDFSEGELVAANIPRHHWRKHTGASVFVVRRAELRV